ncbi:MAG: heme exporter protein CcmD [Gammaproteobacteria bacterium]|nr:heme exporter protein CcmD [Gammaproteobacteria bacterium]
MSFDSFASFVHMGGHGLYVWSAYGIGVIVLAANLIAPAITRRRFFAAEGERARRGAVSVGAISEEENS